MTFALPSDIEVAIVGAGAAGVAAARRLAHRGRRVLLIEALGRVGGRAWTIEVEGLSLDLGCGWLHSAERNPWVGRAEALGHRIDRSEAAWRAQFRNLGFSHAEQHAAREAYAAFEQRLHTAPPPSDRAADALPSGDPWTGFIEALSSYINGAQLSELSVADFLAYDDAASETNWRLPAGYGALIAAEARGLAITLATKVSGIAHDGDGVRLDTDKGSIRAGAAIVTVSTDLLASGTIRLPAAFDPVCHAAACVPLGLADKIFLKMDDPESLPPEQHLLGDPHRAATGSYYLRPMGMPVIEGFFGGAAARALEGAGEGTMAAFAMEELGALLGSDFTRKLRPIAASRWSHEPSVRGSYSHALPGHADKRRVLATPVDERIRIAGEACSIRDFSTAHGALETGIAAADAIEAALARKA